MRKANKNIAPTLDSISIHRGIENTRYFYHTDHLGSSSWISNSSGAAQQYLVYLPFGETLLDRRANTTWNTMFSFSGKERDLETGYSYFGARYYDAGTSIWLSVDPMAGKYPSMSPYAYCGNNPINFIDPDGNEVVAVNMAAQQAILNTLPKDIRGQVQFDNTGRIDKSSFNQINTSSGNFGALSQLVNDTKMFEFNVTDNIAYKDENSNMLNIGMGDIEKTTDYGGDFGMNTGEMGWLGVTQTPGNAPNKYNSTDDVVRITINSGLSPEGQAQLVSHEGYGHAYLYSKGEVHTHQVKSTPEGFKETNTNLRDAITNAIKETIKNMNE